MKEKTRTEKRYKMIDEVAAEMAIMSERKKLSRRVKKKEIEKKVNE